MKSSILFLAYLTILTQVRAEDDEKYHHSFLLPFSGSLDNSTVLLSHSEQDNNNNPLDNLADLREIHQFEIDLSNYTDHEAVESDVEHDIPAFNDHFDIFPDMDTRDYHNGTEESTESTEQLNMDTLNPELYEVVTS